MNNARLAHLRFENIVRDLAVDDAARLAEMRRSPLAERSYLIFFTPRSGSSWLTSLLSRTGRLGFPEEFLNPSFIRDVAGWLNARTHTDLLSMLRRQKRTKNLVFGMEVRHIDVELFGEDVFFATFGVETIIFNLWRDNIVSQGISLYRAVNTGHYHSTDVGRLEPPPYDIAQIKYWVEHVLSAENVNLEMLAKWGRPARFLRYEDIMRDPGTTLRQFADALRVDIPVDAPDLTGSRHAKIGDDWNRDSETRFRRDEADFVTDIESRRLIRRQPGEPGWLAPERAASTASV